MITKTYHFATHSLLQDLVLVLHRNLCVHLIKVEEMLRRSNATLSVEEILIQWHRELLLLEKSFTAVDGQQYSMVSYCALVVVYNTMLGNAFLFLESD